MPARSPRVYLDWNATAPLRPEARDAAVAALELTGNPSSVHAEGRAARAVIERARAGVAALVGADPERVVFTSGATEAAASCLSGRGPVAASDIEHDCVAIHRDPAQRLDVSRDGVVQPTIGGRPLAGTLEARLIAVMAAQNETGSLQPVAEIAAAARAARTGVIVACDAVQAAGRIPLDIGSTGVDVLFLSAHKLGGPKGVGALVFADTVTPEPLIAGGGQERGHRGGTENLPGIAGFGAAAEAAARDLADGVWDRVGEFRTILEKALEQACPERILMSEETCRIPNTLCVSVPGWPAEAQVMQMDLAGFAVSAGAACSSGKTGERRALAAMGVEAAVAQSAIRVSLGPTTQLAEVLAFAEAWGAAARRRRRHAA